MRDLIYAFNKNTFKSYVLGEIQSDFNLSFTIDGTKDSAKVIVWNFNGAEIEPYTIIYHKQTDTWWVVSHDKVERYQNEDGGFVYIHNLELLGAIELLNARDLTDCGFNDNTYTVSQFIIRLFSLSNFEYNYRSEYFFYGNSDILDKTVDFIKTFENYTLLSALREFLDAYNMCPKLWFDCDYNSSNDTYTIENPHLTIVSKTGNYNDQRNISDFDDVRETKTMDKNSFGVTVVSNAENVTSSNPKTFPSNGSVKLSSRNYLIVENDAINDGVIRLPSKVFKGNWIKMLYRVLCYIEITSGSSTWTDQLHYYACDNNSLDKLIQDTKDWVHSKMPSADTDWSNFVSSHRAEIRRKLNALGTITIYNGNNVNPVSGSIEKGANVPYLTHFGHSGRSDAMVFVDKETRDCLPDKRQGIAWERGSNIITGFDFLSSSGGFTTIDVNIDETDYRSTNQTIVEFSSNGLSIAITLPDTGKEYVKNSASSVPLATQCKRWSFIVNYLPMADLKIKIDNQRDKKDVQLYNQNGRVTDCVALSKIINSYSKEISSDTITRYMHYYNFGDVPQVGSTVVSGNIIYVINNISLNITQNEELDNDGYYIECEITMSKWVSTKSLLVNPNTNIRDYGIPQNFNVKRKQLYRDYYELAYQTFSDQTFDVYMPYDKVFNFTYETSELMDLTAIMEIGYVNAVEGSNYWYYQLETTNYYLDKMIMIVLDFQDNNIIGYGSQNVQSGFDISRVFTGFTDRLNTPISYVDDEGKFASIFIEFCNNEQITSIYDDYQESQTGGDAYEGCLYNYSVFIPEVIFEEASSNKTLQIVEPNYFKDALEIPVFEYSCQIDDSDDVLIGDNILKQRPNCRYLYSYVFGDDGETLKPDSVSSDDVIEYRSSDNSFKINHGCHITLVSGSGYRMVNIRFLTLVRVYPNNSKGFGADIDLEDYEGRDVAIFRHSYDLDTGEQNVDLMFIARKIPYTHIQDTSRLNLEINHYKLK